MTTEQLTQALYEISFNMRDAEDQVHREAIIAAIDVIDGLSGRLTRVQEALSTV
jgi:hypothetical protein